MRMEIQTLSTNQRKWDFLQAELKRRLAELVKANFNELPKELYKVEFSGKVNEGVDVEPYYLWPFNTFMNGKSPSKKEIEQLTDDLSKDIPLTVDKLSFQYSYYWDEEKKSKSKTGISYKDFLSMKPPYFVYKSDAQEYSDSIKDKRRVEKEFDELHKKDKNYDYRGNGYKDLGWQNSWHHVYFDEDGKETTGDILKGEKPKKTFGYKKEDYPEYGNCIEQKHRTIEVSHDNRGTQHDVSCPICKLVWHYDSSD